MKSTRRSMHRTWRSLGVLLTLAVAAPAFAQSPPQGTVERITLRGESLVGNLEGNTPDRDVFIYLPPGYGASTTRYPVVYLLHGYGLTGERWMEFTGMAAAADKNIAAGTARPMILVNPDTYTRHGGSMYTASPTTGDWETFIAEELVAYVDRTYRTIPDRLSRGLGGHSMGGYGVLRIGMKRPDVFSVLFPMASCCLIDNNITGGGGRGNAPAGAAGRGAAPNAPAAAPATPAAAPAAAPATPAAAPAAPAPPAPAAAPAGQAAAAPQAAGNRGAAPQAGARGGAAGRGAGAGRGAAAGRGGFGNVQLGLALAWAPNPNNPPNYSDLPVVNGEPQPMVIARYAANSPYVMLPQYVTSLRRYRAIMLDVGEQDGLIGQNRQLVQALVDLKIPHTFETFQGDHTNRVAERIETKVLPFFSANLSFSPAPR